MKSYKKDDSKNAVRDGKGMQDFGSKRTGQAGRAGRAGQTGQDRQDKQSYVRVGSVN